MGSDLRRSLLGNDILDSPRVMSRLLLTYLGNLFGFVQLQVVKRRVDRGCSLRTTRM